MKKRIPALLAAIILCAACMSCLSCISSTNCMSLTGCTDSNAESGTGDTDSCPDGLTDGFTDTCADSGKGGFTGSTEFSLLKPVQVMAAATDENAAAGKTVAADETTAADETAANDVNEGNGGKGGAAETADTLLVVDDAHLLSEEEEARLIADYSVITEYMGAAFISTYFSPFTTAQFAEKCAIEYFQDDPAVLFLIDMDNREIYVYANGKAQDTISRADARAITDNIYKSASRGDYYECADGAFRQIYAKCTGHELARPVKHITNALIAVLLGVLINYFITVFSRIPKAERRTKGEIKASVSSQMAHLPGISLGAAIFLSSVKHYKSSSSGGSGGGGGGHSGGGGGHSF